LESAIKKRREEGKNEWPKPFGRNWERVGGEWKSGLKLFKKRNFLRLSSPIEKVDRWKYF
jgi:hypothetical protein